MNDAGNNMDTDYPADDHVHAVRITIEAGTGVSATTGASHPLFDTLLQRDANGLPCILGSGVAGVLRRFAETVFADQPTTDRLFGPGVVGGDVEMARSKVIVTDALCHLSDDAARDGFDTAPPVRDPLYTLLTADQPIVRDHIRRGEHGVVEDRGKFDRTHVPAGTRFTFGLMLRGCESEPEWTKLIEELGGATLRLGGATRRGLGRLQVIRVEARVFDLRKADDRRAARAARQLDKPLNGALKATPTARERPGLKLSLRPEAGGTFRFGSERGRALKASSKANRNLLKMNTEPRIVWGPKGGGEEGSIVGESLADAHEATVAPGASVKGPLSHRTLYHLRRLLGEMEDGAASETTTDADTKAVAEPRAMVLLEALFGAARDADASAAGRLRIDDVRLAPLPVEPIARVSIDRFTGGAFDGALFSEERLAPDEDDPAFEVVIEFDDWATTDPTTRRAFEMAVEDLCAGRLPLGAGGGKGQGWFEGKHKCEGDLIWP